MAAVVCLSTAFVLIADAGLPERAAITGEMLPDGQAIAPEIGAFAPPFQLTTLNDKTLNLLDMRGQPVLINFWATWCEPCWLEMPTLQTVYQRYQAQGLRLLAVNLGENLTTVEVWARNYGLTFDILLDERRQIAALYWLRGQPSTYVVSPSGIITHIFYGAVTEQALQSALSPYLSG
jgi:peroxiredoxin